MKQGLTGNQLKIIAMLTMTVDHVGMLLFPRQILFRIIGRLAFPVYAYMVAEGCRYTRSMPKYLATIALVAALCQLVYFFAMGSLYQYILVTFSISIGLIWLVRRAMAEKSPAGWFLAAGGLLLAFFVTEVLPALLRGTDFAVDYGFLGVILPLCIYCGRTKTEKLGATALVLTALSWQSGVVQWFSLLALPLLALYNGSRGKWRMKYFFYFYYPAHLVALYFINAFLF